jgi:hypothetical protein
VTTTVIKNADWVVGWDEAAELHVSVAMSTSPLPTARSSLSDRIIPNLRTTPSTAEIVWCCQG